ncbi:MAG: DNA alkylation repair protein [Bacteroidota bacterium]
MNSLGQIVVEELQEKSVPKKADWWNSYLKGKIPFMGLGIPEIRKVLLDLNKMVDLEHLPMNRQVGIVNGLMKGHFAEQKLAAILYIQLFWLGKKRNSFLLNLISDWFDDRLIFDWNTTDWLCVRLITPMLDSGDEKVVWCLKRWSRDPYLWKARASLVPFAACSSKKEHATEIERRADILIRRPERFAKTAVGWVLREYSKEDEEFVLNFLSRHVKYTTSEVKRNALKYYRQKTRTF